MAVASDLRRGMALRLGGEPYRVLSADTHGGGGKMGGVTHAKLQSLATGTAHEHRFRSDEGVETLELERPTLQFLYASGGMVTFMNPVTFDQVEVEEAVLGKAAAWLEEGMTLPVEIFEGRAVGVTFPEVVEATVAETTPAAHVQGNENVWKPARLANGVSIQVPPFIAPGERVRVDVASGRYVERAKRR